MEKCVFIGYPDGLQGLEVFQSSDQEGDHLRES
jgi:hypothetical protein